jgi:hypothetical protein
VLPCSWAIRHLLWSRGVRRPVARRLLRACIVRPWLGVAMEGELGEGTVPLGDGVSISRGQSLAPLRHRWGNSGLPSTDTLIDESEATHVGGIEHVPAIDDERRLHGVPHLRRG